jgi:TonB family protein
MKTKLITVVSWSVMAVLLTISSTLNASQTLEQPEVTHFERPQALDAEAGMVVTVLVTLNANGDVEAVEVQRADAPLFAESVKNVVQGWKFSPALRDGKAIPSKVLVPIRVVGNQPEQFTAR